MRREGRRILCIERGSTVFWRAGQGCHDPLESRFFAACAAGLFSVILVSPMLHHRPEPGSPGGGRKATSKLIPVGDSKQEIQDTARPAILW